MIKASYSKFMLIALLITACIPCSSLADEVTQGALLGMSCAACHGTDGRSPGAIPTIAGKSRDFIEAVLSGFRSGKQASTIMGRHAKGYTDKEIKLIAEYFSAK